MKLKSNNKPTKTKVISGFLGTLLLIVGLSTGIVLVTQPQLITQKASDSTITYILKPTVPPTPSSRSCGANGQSCCNFFGYKSCSSNLTCIHNELAKTDTCGISKPKPGCGGNGQSCCSILGIDNICASGSLCIGSKCYPKVCGNPGESCCFLKGCNPGSTCDRYNRCHPDQTNVNW